jgi:hypothetical protein
MATIINNPTAGTPAEDSSVGVIVGILAVVLLAVLFFIFVYPSINNSAATPTDTGGTNINVELPDVNTTNNTVPNPASP